MSKLLITVLLFLTGSYATGRTLDEDFERAAKKTNVPVKLLKAICFAESNHRPYMYNPDDPGGGAFGICQVLGTTAASFMEEDPKCLKVWKRSSSENNYNNCKYFGRYTNMYLAGRVLRWQMNMHKNDWLASIAGYNSGTPKLCIDGWVIKSNNAKKLYKPRKWGRSSCWKTVSGKRVWQEGHFLNQPYVNRVMKALGRF